MKLLQESSDGEGTLRIGGAVLRVDDDGNVLSKQRKGAGRPRQAAPPARQRRSVAPAGQRSDSTSSEGSGMDAAVQDYLQNLEGSSSSGEEEDEEGQGQEGSSDGSGGRSGGRGSSSSSMRKRLKLLRRFSGADLEDFDGSDFEGSGSSSSSEESEDESSTSAGSSSNSDGESSRSSSSDGESSRSSSSDGESSGEESSSESEGEGPAVGWGGGAGDVGVLTPADLEGLSLEQRYPVQARLRLPPLPGQQQSGKQKNKKHKSGVKGAKGGKLAPGEKAQLRRERITAKRAARAASHGFDLAVVNSELMELVGHQGDMKAFPPMGKHECRAVQRLAALYGLKSGVQGSSKRKFVVVTATERSALPTGEGLLEVGRMLTSQAAYEVHGTAIISGPAAAAAAAEERGWEQGPGSKKGRWAGLRGSRGGGSRGGGGEGAASTAKAKKKHKHRKPPRPVSFVSGGAINPDEAVEVVLAAATAGDVAGAASASPPASPMSSQELGGVPAAAAAAAVAAAAPPPPPDSDAVLASQPGSGAGAAGLGLGAPAAGLGFAPAGAGLGFALPSAARVPAPGAAGVGMLPPAAAAGPGLGFAAAGAGLGFSPAAAEPGVEGGGPSGSGLLEVYEDLSGSESGSEEEGGAPSGPSSRGRGKQQVVYTRLSGAGPGEGITNAGRLLGLGLALGVGAQVFGAPVASPGPDEDSEGPAPDLSPLSPLMSRSEQRRQARRRSAQGGALPAARGGLVSPSPAGAGTAAWEEEDEEAAARQRQQEERRRARKKGRRAGRQQAQQEEPAGAEEEEEEAGGPRLVSGDYGYFERHTTGIGSRLLAKWGFVGEGSGLGRAQQGIAEPVRASRRAKGLGLGAET